MTQTVQIPSDDFCRTMHDRQRAMFRAFDGGCRRFWMRWHRRARKTTAWTNMLIREAVTNPNRVYLYLAPTYKQAKSIVWNDPNMLFKWLPNRSLVPWEKNEQELSVRFPGSNSTIRLVGGDDPDSVRGIDCHGFVADEWPLMKPEIWFEIIRPIIAQDPDRWAAFIFTPKGQNHAYEMDMKAEESQWGAGGEWFYDILTVDDSALIPEPELRKARAEMPPSLYDQEFLCSFISEEEFTLITSAMLEQLRRNPFPEHDPRKLVSCDPAMGGDRCVIMSFNGTKVQDIECVFDRDTMRVVGRIVIAANKLGAKQIVVDSIGIGAGVCDRLKEMGFDVIRFNSAEKASDERFANRKAEAWFRVSDVIREMRSAFPQDIQLRRELSSVKYDIRSNGRLTLVPKDKTKEELGFSPDLADAWVMGQWALECTPRGGQKVIYRNVGVQRAVA